MLNWNSHHIDDYILEVMTLVKDVNETLATIKGNVKRTSEVLAGWGANPMFDRREGKVGPMHTIGKSGLCSSPLLPLGSSDASRQDGIWPEAGPSAPA